MAVSDTVTSSGLPANLYNFECYKNCHNLTQGLKITRLLVLLVHKSI